MWIAASKDAAEAQAFADDAHNKGLSALVFVTTDWSNLNSETWYVVSIGASATEAQADDLLNQAVAAGYADAYVKYSGDPK